MGEQHLRGAKHPDSESLGDFGPGAEDVRPVAGSGLRGGEPGADADPAVAHTYRFAYGEPDAFCDGNGNHEPHSNAISYDEPNSFAFTVPQPDPCSIPHRYGNVIAYSRAAHADARAGDAG